VQANGRGAHFGRQVRGNTFNPMRHAKPADKWILVIDDQAAILDVLEGFLCLDGHFVSTAASADEGLENLIFAWLGANSVTRKLHRFRLTHSLMICRPFFNRPL
jgi:hypothetical protein